MGEPIRPDPAVVYGLIVGTALGLLSGARLTMALLGASPDDLWTVGALLMLGDYVAYFVVGRFTASYARTAGVESGARAGTIAGAQAAIMGGAGSVALAILAPSADLATAGGTPPAGGSLVGSAVILAIGWIVISAGLGAGLATIGGLTMRDRPMRDRPRAEAERHPRQASRAERGGVPGPARPAADI
jgi:hypothetical protein